MKHVGYQFILRLVRGCIYIKRSIVYAFGFLVARLGWVGKLYRETLGVRLYRVHFSIKRLWQRIRVPWAHQTVGWLGRRSTLQIVLFGVLLVVVYPHSTLYTYNDTAVPGRDTVLYALVGPGDFDDVTVDEIIAEGIAANTEIPVYRQGAVVSEIPFSGNDQGRIVGIQEIAGVSAGGGAVIKPSILPGSTLPTPTASGSSIRKRSDIVEYVVRPGDVIGAIAEAYGISVQTILVSNNLTPRSYIRPGQALSILPFDGVLHTVKSGDTVGKIAKIYDAEQDRIISANKLKNDGSDIVVNEDLLIPGGVKPQPRQVYSRSTAIRNISAPPPSVSAPAGSGYIWPSAARIVTQYSHWRHVGADIGGPIGTAIYAARAGVVSKSQCGWNYGYGCHIIVDHGGGVQTLYAHASQLNVNVGEPVSQGQVIMLMGSTGNSTGSHLHFEVRINGQRQNPFRFIR